MSGMTFKSLLNEFCQKRRVALPVYSTKPVQTAQGLSSYVCTVKLFNDASFESQGSFSNKKSAEQNAAERALIALQQTFEPGQQNPMSDVSASGSTPKGIPNDDASSSSNENSLVNSKNTVTIVSTPGRVSMSPVQTVGQQKQITFPTIATAKNMLNERAQKLRISLPSYQTAVDVHSGGFISRVTFNGVTYCSNGGYRLKKKAEKSAAFEALKVLLQGDMQVSGNNATSGSAQSCQQEFSNLEGNNKNAAINFADTTQENNISGIISESTNNQDEQMNIQNILPGTPGPSSACLQSLVEMPTTPTGCQMASEAVSQPSPVSFKNLLQEYMQQRGLTGPKYKTCMTAFGLFKSTVQFCGKMIESAQASSTKKQAEQLAARQALLDLGVEEPEKLVPSKKAKDRTRKLGSLKRKHFQGSGDLDFLRDSPSHSDPRLRKRQRLDQSFFAPKTLKLQSPQVERILGPVDLWSVGELWKEKKNVAIIGNDKTSFVLHCTRVDGSLQILNTRSMENVELKQGYRIVGLDADFVQRQGRLILQSERCADIVIPETPDPVLISCGAVVLHLDPDDSSNTEVLLKRYTHSQAFINVKAALAQFFRRSVSGHPLPLPVASLTEHLQQWALEEVGYIAAMDVPAMQQVFLNFWKFKDSWCSILEPELPNDLRELQTRAQEELSRRISCGANANDASSYPWGLPKGNFRHRMLSTGLHIEKPSECAARELREETGIQVDPSDLEKLSYVDVPQDDNLNPHEGDVARYFLYVYNPIIEELNSSTSDIIMFNTHSESLLQSDQTMCAQGENESKDEEEIARKNGRVKCEANEDRNGGQTTSITSYQESKEENLESASLTDKKTNSSSKEVKKMTSDTKEANTETCPALPSPSVSSLSSSYSPASSLEMERKDLPENLTGSAAETEVDKDSSSGPVAEDPSITSNYCMSSSSSAAVMASSSSSPKKRTPLNTDFEAKDDSSENSNSSLIKKSDPLHPTIPCRSISSNTDPEIRIESKDTKMLDSLKGGELGAKEKADEVSSNVQHSTESCSYEGERGLKRKRGSSDDEESGNEDDDGNQQEPCTSTPVTDTHPSRYQSPTVQGAKHEECSWFSIDEAVKISPTFATIYKTEKFSELLMLLKKTWT